MRVYISLYPAIESESESLQWAASGSNIILYLTAIDPIHVNIGSVLCPSTDVIPLASVFTARIIVFEVQVPITPGASVSTFPFFLILWLTVDQGGVIPPLSRRSGFHIQAYCHARQGNGRDNQAESQVYDFSHITFELPLTVGSCRVLTKSASAEVQITLRSTTISGPTTRAQPIPLELFSVNKEMGRILIRRGGETIAAGASLLPFVRDSAYLALDLGIVTGITA